jgi:hypothetical protein
MMQSVSSTIDADATRGFKNFKNFLFLPKTPSGRGGAPPPRRSPVSGLVTSSRTHALASFHLTAGVFMRESQCDVSPKYLTYKLPDAQPRTAVIIQTERQGNSRT